MASTVNLPNEWRPRPYQLPSWSYLESGGTRCALAWHRRAGKDEVGLHWAAVSAHQKVGTYWHMLPEASQARKAIWEAVNPHTGKRRIDEAFPQVLREATRENEMFIRFKCGSTWQVVGSDNFDSLVGSPPIGVVFSEYSRADPAAWAYLRPILAENGGWALFISTFFGRNHHWSLVNNALKWDDWFGEILSAEVTGVFTKEQLDHEKSEYVADYGPDEGEALFRQEYLCDPSAAILGAYYGPQMAKAEKDERIIKVPYDRSRLVYTGWDLGRRDLTSIWFAQFVGLEPRIIDYYQNNNQDVAHYAEVLKKRGYAYGGHYLPHDGAEERLQGPSVLRQLSDAGIANVMPTPRTQNQTTFLGEINLARNLMSRAVFDAEKCERGLDALRNYRREWDDSLKTFKPTPLHDWASHGADAFRTLAVNWDAIEAYAAGGYSMTGWRDMAVA